MLRIEVEVTCELGTNDFTDWQTLFRRALCDVYFFWSKTQYINVPLDIFQYTSRILLDYAVSNMVPLAICCFALDNGTKLNKKQKQMYVLIAMQLGIASNHTNALFIESSLPSNRTKNNPLGWLFCQYLRYTYRRSLDLPINNDWM
eukprot:scaffold13631_cov38-Cyclotella_meneghiniana.AAC.5